MCGYFAANPGLESLSPDPRRSVVSALPQKIFQWWDGMILGNVETHNDMEQTKHSACHVMFSSFGELPNSVFHPVLRHVGWIWSDCMGQCSCQEWRRFRTPGITFRNLHPGLLGKIWGKQNRRNSPSLRVHWNGPGTVWHLQYSHNGLLKQALFPFRLWEHCDTWNLNHSSKSTRLISGKAGFWIQMHLNNLPSAQPSMLQMTGLIVLIGTHILLLLFPPCWGGERSGLWAPIWAQVDSHELHLWTVACVPGGWKESFGLCHKNAFLLCLLYT